MKNFKLSVKQLKFVHNYYLTGNISEACKYAGYKNDKQIKQISESKKVIKFLNNLRDENKISKVEKQKYNKEEVNIIVSIEFIRKKIMQYIDFEIDKSTITPTDQLNAVKILIKLDSLATKREDNIMDNIIIVNNLEEFTRNKENANQKFIENTKDKTL